MPKVSPIQSNFNGGEISPLLYGRVDLDRYKSSVATMLNYIPTIQGGATRRPGTEFISEAKFADKKCRLFQFEFGVTQAYMLEFGYLYIRFYRNGDLITLPSVNITAITKANPAVVTSNGHGFSNGDRVILASIGGMVELNNREVMVNNVTANTFELRTTLSVNIDSTNYTTYTSGGTASEIYEVVTTYTEQELFQIKFTQSADTLYLAHGDIPLKKLTRTAHTSWTLSSVSLLDGPYLPTNTTAVTITPSGTTGAITLTASSGTFATTDVGRLVRVKHSSTWGYATITAYTSATVVNATVTNAFGATTASAIWALGLYSATTGYPEVVMFHEDRLFLGGADGNPHRFDASNAQDYENFAPTAADGSHTDANSYGFSFNSNTINKIRWFASDEKGLLAGTVGGEWIIRPSSQGEAITPDNVSVKPITYYGSADIEALQVGKATLFVQRSGLKVRENTFFYDVDGFRAEDLTVLAEHITESGIVEMDYQREPQSIVWCVRTDGVLAALTYERDLDNLRVGWHRHILGGSGNSAGDEVIVESVSVIPSTDGSGDEVWFSAKRYINGALHRYIERLSPLFSDAIEQKDAFFVDSGFTYDAPIGITNISKANPAVVTAGVTVSNGDSILISGVAGMTEVNGQTFTVANVGGGTFELSGVNSSSYGTFISAVGTPVYRKYITQISGLFHLEGQSVTILGDGAVQTNKTVSGGKITLSQRATTVQIGLGYNSDLKLLRIEAGAADGTALGKTRRIHRLGILLHRSLGLKIGTDFDALTTLVFRSTDDLYTRAVPLFSGILSENFDADYDFENQICIRQDQPLPSTILSILPQMVTQDRS